MRWPWQRERIDPTAIAHAAATEAADRAAARTTAVVEELQRALIASSPMPGPPNPADGSIHPLYAMDNPIWYSTPQAPSRRPGSVIDTSTLRHLADNYDILRDCLQHLKREVAAVPLRIVAIDAKDDSAATQAEIAQAEAFLRTAGGLGGAGTDRAQFEGELLEDLLVIGAYAVYYHPTRGGGVYEVVNIDAATIRPRVDAWGWPGPGEAVYEQWIQGIQVRGFTRQEMSYKGLPINARSYSPYYWSPVEWLIQVINAALHTDQWNREWITHGTTPADLLALPQDWTVEQIKSYIDLWEAMLSRNIRNRQQTRFVPGGTQRVAANTRKEQEFPEFERWLMQRTCAVMGVHPAAIGFEGDQYAVTQKNSMEQTSAFGARVLLGARATFYTDLFERMGLCRIRAESVVAEEEKAGDRATRLKDLTGGAAVLTINEARAEEGKDPIEGGDTLFVPTTAQPLDVALNPPDPAPGPGPAGNDDDAPGQRGALRMWERKALNRVRRGATAACPFDNDAIRRRIHAAVTAGLARAQGADDVRAVFRAALHAADDEEENA